MTKKLSIITPAIFDYAAPKNVELINDSVFSETYLDTANITTRVEDGLFVAKLSIYLEGFNVGNFVTPRIKEIFASNPEYSDRPDFISPNSFFGLNLDLPRDYAYEYIKSPLIYGIIIGDFWHQKYYKISLTEKYVAYSFFVIHATGVQFELTIRPTIEGATREDLVEAVRSLRFVLIQVSVGVAASGIESSKTYTNGSNHFVENPEFGRMPGGLKFIDVSKWKGEDRIWTREDLSYTG